MLVLVLVLVYVLVLVLVLVRVGGIDACTYLHWRRYRLMHGRDVPRSWHRAGLSVWRVVSSAGAPYADLVFSHPRYRCAGRGTVC